MTHHSTIWMAIDLLRSPSNVRRVRSSSLPKDVHTLLHIAAGDEDMLNNAIKATNRPPQSLRDAAAFFIEQILLHPDADNYRILGSQSGASNAELRRNMALLMRWLHPDRNNGNERSVFVARITRAWNELKTEDRRAAYDRSQRNLRDKVERSKQKGSRAKTGRMSPNYNRQKFQHPPTQLGFLRRLMLNLFGKSLA